MFKKFISSLAVIALASVLTFQTTLANSATGGIVASNSANGTANIVAIAKEAGALTGGMSIYSIAMMNGQVLQDRGVRVSARPDIAANFANTTITVLLENSSSSNANTINKEKRNKNNDVNPIVMTSGDGAYLVIRPNSTSSFSNSTVNASPRTAKVKTASLTAASNMPNRGGPTSDEMI